MPLESLTERLLWSFDGVMFPQCFMFLEFLCSCLRLCSYCHLHNLLIAFKREVPFVSPATDSEAFLEVLWISLFQASRFLWWGDFLICVLSLGPTAHEARCWQPSFCFCLWSLPGLQLRPAFCKYLLVICQSSVSPPSEPYTESTTGWGVCKWDTWNAADALGPVGTTLGKVSPATHHWVSWWSLQCN